MAYPILVGTGEWIEWSLPDAAPFVIFLKNNKDPLRHSPWNGRKWSIGNGL